MKYKKYKKIHCIGIGGIHVSALAKLLLNQGVEISGSDLVKSEITDELKKQGAWVFIGHNNAKLRKICETCENTKDILVIYSDAVPENNPERIKAKELGITQMSSYEFIGELSKDYYTIAISGTNGKSTTTAMLGLILEKAGLDPTVIVGTKVKQWGGNIRIGKSKYLVTEADEYKAHMLKLNPKMIVLTNIEEDHLDFYRNLDDIIEHFKKYVEKLPENGVLVYNKSDCYIAKLLHCFDGKKMGYAVENGFFKLSQISSNTSNNSEELNVKLQVPGEFNKYNAAGAACAAKELGISDKIIKESLEDFNGTWRRFEKVGEYKKSLIISDYAHHPTAVAGTIKATKELYPDRRLIAVFQPHQHNRTRKLFNGFVKAFAECEADVIIISEIYDVAGRTSDKDKKVSSKDLVDAIRCKMQDVRCRRGKEKISNIKHLTSNIIYAKDLEETRSMIIQTIKPNDVVLIMGAGDIDQVAREIVSQKSKI